MILIGTIDLSRTRDIGEFYCPSCRVTQSYRLRTRRPFLTLYFIPVVPIGGAEPFVQCDECRSSWDPNVLEMDRQTHETAQRERFREEALRATVLMTTADGTITEREIAAIQQVSTQLLNRPVERDELGALCASARRLGIAPTNFMLAASKHWSQEQRVTVLKAAFLAASADGELSDEQIKMLGQLRKMFDLTEEEYQSAIEEALHLS